MYLSLVCLPTKCLLYRLYFISTSAVQTNQLYMAVEPCKPMRIFYLEEIENSDTLKIIIQESSRLWNDATVWPLYNTYMQSSLWLSQLRCYLQRL